MEPTIFYCLERKISEKYVNFLYGTKINHFNDSALTNMVYIYIDPNHCHREISAANWQTVLWVIFFHC